MGCDLIRKSGFEKGGRPLVSSRDFNLILPNRPFKSRMMIMELLRWDSAPDRQKKHTLSKLGTILQSSSVGADIPRGSYRLMFDVMYKDYKKHIILQ